MDIIILRHGEAGKRLEAGSKDMERSLTVAGAKEVEQVAEAMSRMKLGIDHISASPLKRAHETAAIAGRVLKKEIESWDELRPEGKTSELFSRLSRMKDGSTILLVGHEPYLSGMISELIHGDVHTRIVLKKSGLAKVSLSSLVPRPAGELRWLLTPRQARKMA